MSHAMFDYSFSYRIDELACINLCFSSLYWFTGVWTTISSAYKNTRVFTTKSFTTDFFFDLVAKQKVTTTSLLRPRMIDFYFFRLNFSWGRHVNCKLSSKVNDVRVQIYHRLKLALSSVDQFHLF